METIARKPFQGLVNIIRFNWHWYVLAVGMMGVLGVAQAYLPEWLGMCVWLGLGTGMWTMLVSLAVSWYVYNGSGLYQLHWLNGVTAETGSQVVTMHAGFDETSFLLAEKFPLAQLRVFDFYDPAIHTEVSIKRARNIHTVFPGTESISTTDVPLQPATIDLILLILSAHEIRQTDERIRFFHALQMALKPSGQIIVVEHLRDVPNFLAYTIGFLHFHSQATWKHTFALSGLSLCHERKLTPFISAFFLQKNGSTS